MPAGSSTAIVATATIDRRDLLVAKRSVTIAGHRTSLSLEQSFWEALGEIAATQRTSVAGVIAEIDRKRKPDENLSAAIRVFVLGHFRKPPDG